MMFRTAAIIIFVGFSAQAGAYDISCFQPSVPFCVTSRFTYESDFSFRSCKTEMELHLSSVRDYQRCIHDQARNAAKRANEAVEYFNCMAKTAGEGRCLFLMP